MSVSWCVQEDENQSSRDMGKKSMNVEGPKNSTSGLAFALHMVNLVLILGIPQGPLSTVRSNL